MTDKEFFKKYTSKPVMACEFMNVKSPDFNNLNRENFDYEENEKKLYCDSCGHKSFIYACSEEYKDEVSDNEEDNGLQMLCPKCFSWNYFEDRYTWDIKITKWNNI